MTISNSSILKNHWANCYQISTSLLGLREQIFVQTVETLRNQPNQVQDPIQDQAFSNNAWPWVDLEVSIWRQAQENADSDDFVDSFKDFCLRILMMT